MLNGECKAEKNIVKFFLYISEIFHEIFQGKKFHEILHHYLLPPPSAASPRQRAHNRQLLQRTGRLTD